MRSLFLVSFSFVVLSFFSCSSNKNKVFDEFSKVSPDGWNWNQGVKFTFTIEDSTQYYDLSCGLRITGSYLYSNVWIIYQLDGGQIARKNQFGITLSDNTGKWLGKGQTNLLSYEQVIMKGVKFRPGKYTLQFFQNMRDENLKSVSDIGLSVVKSGKIY
jgi:gliding motility-associated lipoprotein GldH